MGVNKDQDLGTRVSGVRFLVLGWLCLAAAIAYIDRGAIAVPVRDIQNDLQLSDEDMSTVMSSFFLGYAIFQIPGGWLGNRWGTRLALTLFALAWSMATGMLGLAAGFYTLLSCHFANGIAQSGIFPCCVQSISRWFPTSQRALPSGILGSFMSIGGMIATGATAFLLRYVSWPTIFPLLALLGLLWAVGFYAWFRDDPREHPWVNDAERELIAEGEQKAREPSVKPATPWSVLLTSPQMFLIAAQQFFRAAGYVFYTTWFPAYLQETRSVSVENSGYLATFPLLTVVFGAVCGGAASDWIQRRTGSRRLSRQVFAMVNMSMCALFYLLAYFVHDVTGAVTLIALGTFFAGMGGPVAYTITMDVGGKHISTVFSLMNMAGNIGGALCPKLVTWLVASTGNWNLVLLMFVAIYAASAACWLFVKPSLPIVREQ